jgi:hypothetical protein
MAGRCRRIGPGTRGPRALAWLLLATGAAMLCQPGVASAAGIAVTITPSPSNGQYHDGQTVAVSVGPNSLFVPNTRVVILECADPGGSAANLPTSLSNCDENTVQGETVLVQANGSISEKSYPLYALPSATLGEQSNWQPVCSATQQCVLFVGEDQNDFTKPKVLSQPFSISGGGAAPQGSSPTAAGTPAAGGGTTAAGTSSTQPIAGASAAVSLPAATLAFTGVPAWAPWLVAVGMSLAGLGALGRRAVRRWGR